MGSRTFFLPGGALVQGFLPLTVNEVGNNVDFLKKHRAEVLEMILTTYNKKLHEKTLRREGRDEGIQNINRLNGYLLADKRYSDLERSTKDTEYQEKLLKEYGIE